MARVLITDDAAFMRKMVSDALTKGGVLAVWSARDDRRFEQRLKYAGFRVEIERVRARLKKGGPRHTIFLGTTSQP